FTHFLADHYPPFTYGSRWLLVDTQPWAPRLLVPWDWLTCTSKDQYRLDPGWSTAISPSQCGLTPGSSWLVCEATSFPGALGVAVNEERLLRALRRNPKSGYYLTETGYLGEAEAASIGPNSYRVREVLGGLDLLRPTRPRQPFAL